MRRTLLLLPLLGLQINIPRAWACTCAPWTVTEWYENTDAAYVGEVISAGGFLGCGDTRVQVTEAFKGVEVGDVLTIEVTLGDGKACGLYENPFEEGDEGLFFGLDQPIGLCSRVGPPTDAELAELRELSAG